VLEGGIIKIDRIFHLFLSSGHREEKTSTHHLCIHVISLNNNIVSSEPLIRFVVAVLGRIKGGLTLSVGPSWKHTCEIKICLWFL